MVGVLDETMGGGGGWAVGSGREDGVIVVLGLQGKCACEGARGQKKISCLSPILS